ncbi:MAG: hypothetical protein H6591_09980 [Flavobacteriales bacterium]|nr:hypothetical protein [Flavobacteriales bacterium]
MDLQRRLTLYLLGLIIGGGLAYWFYGERLTTSAWLPEEKVKSRLRSTLLKASTAAQNELDARHLDLHALRAGMDSASVDFGASTRGDDSLVYAVKARIDGHDLQLRISAKRDFDRDSVATLLDLR